MNGPICPAEGCQYNEDGEKSAASVRRHMNAKTDEAHSDLKALRAALNQSEGTPEGGAEGASDEPEDDEQGEAVGEQSEQPENSETEQGDMDQSEEYEQQVADSTGEESTDEHTQTEGQQGDDRTGKSAPQWGGWGVPGGPLAVGLGLVVLVAVLLAVTSGDDEEPREVESTVETDTEVSAVDEGEPDGPNVAAWGADE